MRADAKEKRAEVIHTEFKAPSKTWEAERDKRVKAERAPASCEAFRRGLGKNLHQITRLHEAVNAECGEVRRQLDSERTSRTDAQRDLAAAKAEVTAANNLAGRVRAAARPNGMVSDETKIIAGGVTLSLGIRHSQLIIAAIACVGLIVGPSMLRFAWNPAYWQTVVARASLRLHRWGRRRDSHRLPEYRPVPTIAAGTGRRCTAAVVVTAICAGADRAVTAEA